MQHEVESCFSQHEDDEQEHGSADQLDREGTDEDRDVENSHARIRPVHLFRRRAARRLATGEEVPDKGIAMAEKDRQQRPLQAPEQVQRVRHVLDPFGSEQRVDESTVHEAEHPVMEEEKEAQENAAEVKAEGRPARKEDAVEGEETDDEILRPEEQNDLEEAPRPPQRAGQRHKIGEHQHDAGLPEAPAGFDGVPGHDGACRGPACLASLSKIATRFYSPNRNRHDRIQRHPDPRMSNESTLWQGTPSQVLNLPALFWGLLVGAALTLVAFLVLVLTGPILIAVVAAVWVVCLLPWVVKAINTRFDKYALTNERLRHSSGILNRSIEVLELYRVKDLRIEQPFHFRLFGLSRILLETSDRSTPLVILNGVSGGMELADLIRRNVEVQRDKKRVREVDFDDDPTA